MPKRAAPEQQPLPTASTASLCTPRVEGDAMHLQRVGFNHPPLQALHHHRVG
jgi:hypothetical protein